MKATLQRIYDALKVVKNYNKYLSQIVHRVDNKIFLDREKLSQEEIKSILDLAKEWNGRIEVEVKSEKEKRRVCYTTFYRLYFGYNDLPFFIQLTHNTSYNKRIGSGERLMTKVVYGIFSDSEHSLGYYNKGMLKYCQEIGIPIIEKKAALDADLKKS